MITAIALDDEPPALKVLEEFCRRSDLVQLEKSFSKPNDALKFLNKFPVDLIFLDINMPSVSGIDFYKSLKQEIMVIFTTAHSTFAVESYSLSAVDYLLKPFTVERFFQAINKATEYYHFQHQRENPKTFFFIRADYSLIKINFSDILYIEGLSDYIKIYLPDQKPVVARMTMKSILEKLPAHEFMRVHRSFIIPVSRIERIQNKTILVAGVEISIGISYEETFFKHFKS